MFLWGKFCAKKGGSASGLYIKTIRKKNRVKIDDNNIKTFVLNNKNM